MLQDAVTFPVQESGPRGNPGKVDRDDPPHVPEGTRSKITRRAPPGPFLEAVWQQQHSRTASGL